MEAGAASGLQGVKPREAAPSTPHSAQVSAPHREHPQCNCLQHPILQVLRAQPGAPGNQGAVTGTSQATGEYTAPRVYHSLLGSPDSEPGRRQQIFGLFGLGTQNPSVCKISFNIKV